jgi:uncharacterized protein (TIGR00645 family)
MRGAEFERFFERLIYASRWLLAPVYFGMSVALLALAIKFFQEVFHILLSVIAAEEPNLVLAILTLIDLVLVGSLLVMVMISGYENSVSSLEVAEETEKLYWLGKLDTGTLKMKVSASIVAISAIHLLKVFMNAEHIDNAKIMWSILLHVTFVFSALIMAVIDKITRQSQGHDEDSAARGHPSPGEESL